MARKKPKTGWYGSSFWLKIAKGSSLEFWFAGRAPSFKHQLNALGCANFQYTVTPATILITFRSWWYRFVPCWKEKVLLLCHQISAYVCGYYYPFLVYGDFTALANLLVLPSAVLYGISSPLNARVAEPDQCWFQSLNHWVQAQIQLLFKQNKTRLFNYQMSDSWRPTDSSLYRFGNIYLVEDRVARGRRMPILPSSNEPVPGAFKH